ncbi:hypothetical protein Nepgr_000922 [Nepenthes gracilis]|uniref:Uncharacterized protein n=1 Tax=Nepenthes gracilis TaxID=150966 RepID=A0AAD3P496_NEPGR|nr:hypothetical protein Nepgr_000922 [Nepenthes gracilis]
MESLQRTISDITYGFVKEVTEDFNLLAISEIEEALCECCGMSEECTVGYINCVREMFSGKVICGLCAEAVKGEMAKNGGKRDEAVNEHMSACVKFNRFGRTYPALYQAEAVREILKKRSNCCMGKPSIRKDKGTLQNKGGIARSSSCLPAITPDIPDRARVNS